MTQPNILELAKQGDARAITSLLNRSLQPKGITAKAAKRDGILHVLLEGETPPNQSASIRCIHQGLQKLGFVDTPITIYGREQGSAEVCWQSHLDAPLVGEMPMMADSSESEPPLQPQSGFEAPSATAASGESWNEFDFRAAENDDPTAISDDADGTYRDPASAWNNDLSDNDFALDAPDEPTLIVPPQPDEDLDNRLNDEDSDSEILLSLWDDAGIDEDDMVESSTSGVSDLDLWQDGGVNDVSDSESATLAESPDLIGEPQPKRKGSSSLLPLVFLAAFGLLGGAAVASRLGMVRLPWLANIPGIGTLLTPSAGEGALGAGPSGADLPGGDGQPSPAQAGTADPEAASQEGATTPITPPPAVSRTAEAPAVAENPFRDGVNAATKAANLAPIARSTEDWAIIAEHWSEAVNGMKSVPADHPQYALAQAKVSEYQKNLDYASRLAMP